MATVAYIKRAVSDAITSAVSSNGKSLAEQITDEACKLLADKIPVITTNITNEVISKLNTKIDGETFSTDFVNVLQQKLLDEKKTSEPFLSKFSVLFDNIIKKAEENNDNEKQPGDDDLKNASAVAEANPVEDAEADAAPVEEADAAPVEEADAAPVEEADAAPVEEAEAAPVEEAEAAPVEEAEAAPVEEAEAAPVAEASQLGGNAKRTTRRGKRKVKMQTRKRKRRTNKRNKK